MITSNTNVKVGCDPAVYSDTANMHPKSGCDSDMAAERTGKKGGKSFRVYLGLKLADVWNAGESYYTTTALQRFSKSKKI